MIYNNVTLRLYSSGAIEITNAGLDKAQDVTFTQNYPGGMCTGMTFYIPRDVVSSWAADGTDRICAYNGLNMVWEGYIMGITPTVTGAGMGVNVTCAGAWAKHLMKRGTRKPWADTRTDDAAWAYTPTIAGEAKCSASRSNNSITFEPKSTRDAAGAENGWATNDLAQVVYTAPTGQTIKRITLSYDLQEGAQAWILDGYCGGNILNITSSNPTPGTKVAFDSSTIATPSQSATLGIISGANQLPATDGSIYACFGSVVVYTELGSINAQEIAIDIAGAVTAISTDTSAIGALTLSLVPFIANGFESYADLLTRAASFGDSSFNRWACYVGLSQDASDSLPRLVLEQQPALTDYDYAIRMDDDNVTSDLAFTQDFDGIRNWIAIQYNDASGQSVWVTPDDDANLKDATSISTYGQMEEPLSLNTSDLTAAKNYARRLLANMKDPQWKATGTLSVTGYIRSKNSQRVPASEIQPGNRVKIENWLNDLSGTGLTFLITGTTYNDAAETCDLEIGLPDDMEVRLLRMEQENI